MIKKRFLSMLVLLCLTVSGAWAQNPSWVRSYDTWDEATKTLTVNDDPRDIDYAGKEEIEHVIIANTNRVKTIGEAAFKNCSNLTSVSIPSSVTNIGASAFESTKLTSVSIPSSVTTISEATFKNCSNLTSVSIPSTVTTIGEAAFANCSNLTSVSIPSSVTNIGEAAFESTGLTSVTIPGNVTTISEATFKNCSNLTSVSIPSSVTTIGRDAFANCSNLKSVSIPSSVTNIGSSAFESTGLTSVTIPGNVTTIGENAFFQCGNLKTVTLGNGGGSIVDNAFAECGSLTKVIVYAESAGTWKLNGISMFGWSDNYKGKIYVPSNLVDEFKKDDYWSYYSGIIVAIPYSDVTLKEGTEDATSWQGKAGEGEYQALPLEDLAAGTTVSLKYSGWKLVKSVKARKKATAEDKGKLICTDGHIHAYGEDAECTKARVAKIIYIGPTGHATYRNGLALALTDEGGWHTWQEAINACSAKNRYTTPVTNATWLLASKAQWDYMLGADGAGSYEALRDGFSSVGGSNLKSDPGLYWSSTEHESDEYCEKWCYVFDDGHWGYNNWMNDCWARACLAFGALKTVPLNHSANNTWAIAEMPDDDVELEVEYFNITVPTANTADIYAGWTTPLINAGSTTGGATMKYLVTATNEQPTSTDGFSAAVPTAQATAITGPSTYYVWYYLDFESGDDSDISALAVEVTVSVHVTMKEGTFDADNWQGKAGTGEYQALPLTDLEPGTAVTVKYNGTKLVKSVKAKKAPALNLTSPAVGQVIGDDGKNYDYASLPGGVTAVAKICYVSGSNGLALALTDEGQMNWSTAISICAAHIPAFTGGTWKLATEDDWDNMITAAGGYTALRDGFSGITGASNLQSVGYWSSTEDDSDYARFYHFDDDRWYVDYKTRDYYWVRACLAFGAQGPDPIELTSTDGETWTLASMPDYDVELEVTYYPTHAITVKEGTLDATSWQGKAGEGNYQALPLERVYAGTALSVKYNGTKKVKSVKAKGKTAAEATAEDKGKLIGADGYIYDTKDEVEDAGTTAVAKIIYIGPTGHATYNHGLALALTDEASTMVWQDAINACSAKNTSTPVTGATWLLASKEQWEYMMGPDGAGSSDALRDGFSSVGGSNLLSDYYNPYWSSTENGSYNAWRYYFYYGTWIPINKGYDHRVRACLAFGAQGSGPDPIELTSTDGKTWTLASMPYYDVELEVEYYTYAITVKEGTLDATSWQGKAGEGNYQALPLEGVDPDKAVSVKYSGTKKVKSVKAKKAAPALNLTSPAVGQVIGDDGKNYDYASLPGDVTAVAKICYVSGSNGLALALTDEGEMNWITAIPTCAAHTPAFTGGTWKLATKDEWSNMITAAGGYEALRDGFSSVGGSNLQSYRYWSSTEYREGFLDYAWNYNFYDIGLGWDHWGNKEGLAYYVRACLAFGAQETVTLNHSANNTWAIASMPYYDVELEVEYETALALSETTDNSAALTEWNGYEADVTLTRTLSASSWNTFAAPFSTAIPSGWTVKELSSTSFADGTLTLNFANAASLVAGTPYLVKVAANTDLSTAPFTGAIVSKEAQPFTSTDVDFIPTLGATTIPDGDTKAVLFLAAGNKLLNPSALPANIKGFRAYFQLKGEAALARAFSIDFGEGETTGIIAIGTDRAASTDNATYTLDGRRISKATQKGVYIQNGKKVVIK